MATLSLWKRETRESQLTSSRQPNWPLDTVSSCDKSSEATDRTAVGIRTCASAVLYLYEETRFHFWVQREAVDETFSNRRLLSASPLHMYICSHASVVKYGCLCWVAWGREKGGKRVEGVGEKQLSMVLCM
mmetsp:Transcript_10203/g.26738  ORF Transcript_10203/g.26738 Transcript_10203/m.26738 type:complete len:131 (-) Transcript_10203:180-572(-)